jgi:hypothetical protein
MDMAKRKAKMEKEQNVDNQRDVVIKFSDNTVNFLRVLLLPALLLPPLLHLKIYLLIPLCLVLRLISMTLLSHLW